MRLLMGDSLGTILGPFYQHWDYFLLVFIRTAGLIVTSPLFGRRNIPNVVKILYSFVLAFSLFFLFPNPENVVYNNLFEYVLLCCKEFLIGIILSFVTTLFFSIAYSAGQMIDMQIGFGLVNVYDYQSNIQIPITGNLLNLILLITFFTVNGHHNLIYILKSTFQQLPVGTIQVSADIGLVAVEVFAMTFVLAVKIAMPVIATGLFLEILMGVLIRTVPQMNMFVVGIPVKILVGFVILLFIIPIFTHYSESLFVDMFASLEKMFSTLVMKT